MWTNGWWGGLAALVVVALGSAGCVELKDDSGETGAPPADDGTGGGGGGGGEGGEPDGMAGMLAAHNAVRAGVGVPDLVWDDALAVVAAEWSASLSARGCILEHDYSSPYGENLYWSTFESTPQQVVDAWASEVEHYDYGSNSCAAGEQCGHYTQLVWSTTERVGCARVVCGDGAEIWMCDYDPPGNYVGERPY